MKRTERGERGRLRAIVDGGRKEERLFVTVLRKRVYRTKSRVTW